MMKTASVYIAGNIFERNVPEDCIEEVKSRARKEAVRLKRVLGLRFVPEVIIIN